MVDHNKTSTKQKVNEVSSLPFSICRKDFKAKELNYRFSAVKPAVYLVEMKQTCMYVSRENTDCSGEIKGFTCSDGRWAVCERQKLL